MTDSITRSFLLTKLQRPRLGRRLVPRPRLLEQLNPPNSLTCIIAPAGYGKTTLLSIWLETCPIPNAWLSLDERDNDLTVFVGGLAEALHSILPAAVDNTLTILDSMTLAPAAVVTRALLNDLALIQQDFILVLDDYHVVQDKAIHDLLSELVSHPPGTLHLVIASRHDPLLRLAGLRARGYISELRGGDLRFTPEEATQFLAETMALTLDKQTLSVLTAKFEGWPAGLRLAALALRQRIPLGQADTLDDDHYIIDYLAAEVLSQLPISVQEFLIKTSFLDQLCGPLCEAVTGMADSLFNGQPILEGLERADFFLTAVDSQRHWYRCHQLFRQLLRDRLRQRYGPAEITALQLRASTWFADNGYLDKALVHALAADDIAAAVHIIAQHRYELMNQAQWQRLERWLHLFPREVIDEQPHLLLIESWMRYIRNRLDDMPTLLARIQALLPCLSPEVGRRLQGEVDARRAGVYFWSGDWARSMTYARQALEKLPAEWWYIRGFTRLWLGVGYQMSGDLTQAYATYYATGEPDQSHDYRTFLMGMACFVHWMYADLVGMAQAARQVVADSTLSTSAEVATWSQYHFGLYHYQRNDLASAEKYLLPLATQPYLSNGGCFVNSAVLLARIRQFQGRPEEAQEIADRMVSFALEVDSQRILSNARAFQAELALRQGRLAEASQWAEQYGAFRRAPTPFAFVPPLVQALIGLAQDTPASRQQARALLTEMDDYYCSIHYTSGRIHVLALQALLFNAEGDEQQALAVLSNSIALAAPGGFIRLFVDLGPTLKPLLQKLKQRGGATAYLAEIIAAFEVEDAWRGAVRPTHTGLVSTPPDAARLTNREQEVLGLLTKRYTDKEIAETLCISVGTVRSHIEHLGEKLNATGRHDIVQAARDQSLLA